MKLQGRPNAEISRGRVAASTDRSVRVGAEMQQATIGNSDVQIRQEAQPVQAEFFVKPDNISVTGVGIGEDPLRTIPGGTAVAVDDVTIGGTGETAEPLHALFPGFYDNVKVAVDGVSIVGSGLAGDPLTATGGGPGTTNVQPFSYEVTGLEPDPLNLTIPIVPSQPDGDYQATVSQGACAFIYGMQISAQAGASLVLSLTYPATAGDVFEFVLARAA